MLWLTTAGWIALGLVTIGVLAFALTSIQEREWRALGVTLLGSIPLLGSMAVVLLWAFPGRDLVLAGLLGVGVLVAFLLLLPVGSAQPIRAVEEQPRIDERDAVFHRFYRLEPGTPEFDEYYRDHPERKKFDDKVRALPGLGAPDSKTYHPLTSPFMVATFALVEELAAELEHPMPPLEAKPVQADPEELTRRIKGFARYLGAPLVGCAPLNPAYVYSHSARGQGTWGAPITLDHPNAVVIGVEMAHEMVRQAPDTPTTTETAFQYLESAKIAILLARYIQLLGYRARAHVDSNYQVMCVPLAVDAGLGELGRLGLLITPQFGPRVRLAAVTTDLPLAHDQPVDFGAARFCELCLKCAEICPSNSVDEGERQEYAGVKKWQTRRDSCYRYWRVQGTDCALCVRVCPFSHPATAMHNLVRWAIRRNHLSRQLGLWADDLCYGRKPARQVPPPDWHGGRA